jgi:hypothetical protein
VGASASDALAALREAWQAGFWMAWPCAAAGVAHLPRCGAVSQAPLSDRIDAILLDFDEPHTAHLQVESAHPESGEPDPAEPPLELLPQPAGADDPVVAGDVRGPLDVGTSEGQDRRDLSDPIHVSQAPITPTHIDWFAADATTESPGRASRTSSEMYAGVLERAGAALLGLFVDRGQEEEARAVNGPQRSWALVVLDVLLAALLAMSLTAPHAERQADTRPLHRELARPITPEHAPAARSTATR